MYRVVGLSVLLALGLSACSTAQPELAPLQTRAPGQFQGQDLLNKLAQAASSQAAAQWWAGFGDPTLNTLIEQAIRNNFTVRASAARVQEAQALLQLNSAQEGLFVELDAVATAQRSERGNLLAASTGGSGSASNVSRREEVLGGIGIALPLDVAGGLQQQTRAAAANLLALQAQLRADIVNTSTAVAQEYLRMRGNQKQLDLLRGAVALQEETLKVVRARFEAGLSPELDVRRAETSVENLRASIAPLEKSVQDARFRLATLAGRFAWGDEAALAREGELPTFSGEVPNALPLQVLQNRPEVQVAQARFAQAAAEVGVAQADFYPSVALMTNLRFGNVASNGNPAVGVLVGALSAMISQVVWDGGARQAQLDAAKARADGALANYEQVLREVVQGVELALTAVDASSRRQQALMKAVTSSRRSFEQAEALYQLGLISFLDVVDAQRVLANAEQTLAAEQTEYALRITGLFQALGVQHSFPQLN